MERIFKKNTSMIETNSKREILAEGISDTLTMRLASSPEAEAHIIKVLTENYLFPKESHLRESCSNHLDSHVENGNPEHPITVKLYKNETGNFTLETIDEGLGLSPEDFDKYFMGVGESSKKGKANLIGKHGCGAKAALSCGDSYNVICRKNGMENSFLIFKGELRPERTLIYSKSCSEPNGVIVKLNIDRWDVRDFKTAIKEQLCYFPTVFFDVEGENYNESKIYENDLFRWSSLYPDDAMHISFGTCHYPINWKVLKINAINVPVAIKIPIDSGIDVQFNRESLTYDKFAKEYIMDRTKLIADYFVTEYNKTTHFQTFKDAYNRIGEDVFYVQLAGERFKINDLIQYSDVERNKITIEGITLNSPEFYEDKLQRFFYGYTEVGYYTSNGKWKKDKIYKDTTVVKQWIEKGNIVIVNQPLTGNVKEYLKNEYPYNTLFVTKTEKRPLRSRYLHKDYDSYWDILNLSGKKNKRKYIDEWNLVENEVLSVIKEAFDIDTKDEYIEFVQEKKAEQKRNRCSGNYTSNYVSLNKQKGEIIINLAREHSYNKTTVFNKLTRKIEDLNSLGKLSVYFTKEEITDELKERLYYFKTAFPKIDFIWIGKSEIKHIKNNIHFKTMSEFKETRPFARVASALFIEEIRNAQPNNEKYIFQAFPKYQELKDRLTSYVRDNYPKAINNSISKIILEEATATNNWDENIYSDALQLQKLYKQFAWIKYLDVDDRNIKNEERRIINNLIYSLCLQKKINNTEFEDMELISVPPVQVLQDMYISDKGSLENCIECEYSLEELEELNHITQYEG